VTLAFFLPILGVMDRIVDLRHEQVDPPVHSPPKHKIVKGKVVTRDPRTVDGIVIHQTACEMGISPLMVRKANGDKQLAEHRRGLNVATHVTAFSTGYAVVSCPLEWYVYNANTLNSRILGLEIEGSYPGLLKTATASSWKFEGEIVEAAKAGLRFLVEEGRKLGMPIKFLWAHRQSSATRRSDPGEEIWQKLVVEYAVPKLNLVTRTGDVFGDGRPIPKEWDQWGLGRF
jgi:hypothetical protein